MINVKPVLFAASASAMLFLSACNEAAQLVTENSPVAREVARAVEAADASSKNGFPAKVKKIEVEANKTFEVKGNLDNGEEISDLSWADRSSTACFPGTQFSKFRANHVLYHMDLPPRSILKITLIPDDTSGPAMSLYGYQIGTTNYSVVPELGSAVTCEADHINDRPVRGKVEDGSRSIRLNATTNPYNVVIGVSGQEGASGGFTLQVELEQ